MALLLAVKDAGAFLVELATMQGMEPITSGPALSQVQKARLPGEKVVRRCSRCGDVTHVARNCDHTITMETRQLLAHAKANPKGRFRTKAEMVKATAASVAARAKKKAGRE